MEDAGAHRGGGLLDGVHVRLGVGCCDISCHGGLGGGGGGGFCWEEQPRCLVVIDKTTSCVCSLACLAGLCHIEFPRVARVHNVGVVHRHSGGTAVDHS